MNPLVSKYRLSANSSSGLIRDSSYHIVSSIIWKIKQEQHTICKNNRKRAHTLEIHNVHNLMKEN